MTAGPVAATVLASLCFGAAAVLQQRGARRVPVVDHLDLRLLLRLARQPPFAAGLVLDAAGFALSAWALRVLPLFVVQAGAAASLAVTAVLSARTLGESLTSTARWAVVATGGGVLLLALSAGEDAATPPGLLAPALLVGVAAVIVLAAVAHRLRGRGEGVALGILAGAAFAGFAIAGRVAVLDDASSAVADPAAWALVAYLLVGLTLYGASLQRGSVTVVTASYVALEVVLPTAVGVLLLGDAPRPGTAPVGAAGFALVLAGVVALARADGATSPPADHPGFAPAG